MTSTIMERIRNRLLSENKNFLLLVTGETGSGKSYSAIRIASQLDPKFSIKHLAFTGEGFMQVLNSKSLKQGSAVVFDEAGVGLSSRQWFTLSNRLINFVLQTFRNMNLIVIFTVPDFSFLDSQVRKLFHANLETCAIDYKKKNVVCKFFTLQTSFSGKVYRKYSRKIDSSGATSRITQLRVGIPPANLVKSYEIKKKKFSEELRHSVLADLQEIKEKRIEFDPHKTAEQVLKDLPRFTKQYRGNTVLVPALVSAEFGLGAKRTAIVKAIIEKNREKRDS